MIFRCFRAEESLSEADRPSRCVNALCLPLCAFVCNFMDEAECVPALDGGSKRGPFVGDCVVNEKAAEMCAEIVGKGEAESKRQTEFLHLRFCNFLALIVLVDATVLF